MWRDRQGSDRDERTIFDTIAGTYQFAGEGEQRAMVSELRDALPTIPADERQPLIDAIERSIGEGLSWQEPEI